MSWTNRLTIAWDAIVDAMAAGAVSELGLVGSTWEIRWRSPLITLRECGLYEFDPTSTSPYAGFLLIASSTRDGYVLFTADEWDRYANAHLRVDCCGRILCGKQPTGYTAEMLIDTGLVAGEHRIRQP